MTGRGTGMGRFRKLLQRKRRPLIGIDISAARVKLLELDGNTGTYRVLAYASEALPEDAIADHQVIDAEAVAVAVARALERSGTAARDAAIAVSGPAVISKIVEMPADLSDDEMERQIGFDAQQYIPHPLDEVNLDFRVLEPAENNPDINRVLVVACRRETIEMRVAALEMGGVRVRVVDVEEYALQNACTLLAEHTPGMADNGRVAVFDIGAHRTRLTVPRNHRDTYSREIAFGGHELAAELQTAHGLADMDQLRARLRTGELGAAAIAREVSVFAQHAADQIERALQFYISASARAERIDQVIVVGGATLYPGFEAALDKSLSQSVALGNPLAGMLASGTARSNHVDTEGPALMIAAGLALRGMP